MRSIRLTDYEPKSNGPCEIPLAQRKNQFEVDFPSGRVLTARVKTLSIEAEVGDIPLKVGCFPNGATIEQSGGPRIEIAWTRILSEGVILVDSKVLARFKPGSLSGFDFFDCQDRPLMELRNAWRDRHAEVGALLIARYSGQEPAPMTAGLCCLVGVIAASIPVESSTGIGLVAPLIGLVTMGQLGSS